MVPIAVESVPSGSKPPAAVRVRIFAGERHGLALQRRCLPGRHTLNKGESEVSGLDRPGSQKSYSNLSLDLLQRSTYDCESWCLMTRLAPWQDVAAEHLAPDLLNAVLWLSSYL